MRAALAVNLLAKAQLTAAEMQLVHSEILAKSLNDQVARNHVVEKIRFAMGLLPGGGEK